MAAAAAPDPPDTDGDTACDVPFNPALESAMDFVFYRDDELAPELVESRETFEEFVGMLSAWWGEDGFFAPYWDRFTGDDDFRELGPTKPWTPVTATDNFNCGFSELMWVAYRKKQSATQIFPRRAARRVDKQLRRSSERSLHSNFLRTTASTSCASRRTRRRRLSGARRGGSQSHHRAIGIFPASKAGDGCCQTRSSGASTGSSSSRR